MTAIVPSANGLHSTNCKESQTESAIDRWSPQAPSIATARMAATCGVGLNSAVATGINVLGDVHGGAGEQSMHLYGDVLAREDQGDELADAVRVTVAEWRERQRYLPGFGHRFHPVDPRCGPLAELVEEARARGDIEGRHLQASRSIEAELGRVVGRLVPVNVDGVTAAPVPHPDTRRVQAMVVRGGGRGQVGTGGSLGRSGWMGPDRLVFARNRGV